MRCHLKLMRLPNAAQACPSNRVKANSEVLPLYFSREKATKQLFRLLNDAELDGKVVLRLAVNAALTQLRHIEDVWTLICSKADEVLAQ